jgi:hypothetical protein
LVLAAYAILDGFFSDRTKVNALTQAATVLEYALSKSKYNYHVKILLIRIYFELGVSGRALDISHSLDVKQMQHDTLSYLYTTDLECFAVNSHTRRQLQLSLSIYDRNQIEVFKINKRLQK